MLKQNNLPKINFVKSRATSFNMKSWSCIFLILATVAVTCVPVIASDYGYADDFWILALRPLNSETISSFAHNQFDVGRPLFPLWALGVVGQANGIQDLKFVRLIAAFGLFCAAVVFYKLVRRHLVEDRIDAALIACIFSINPSFLIMAGWVILGCYPLRMRIGVVIKLHFFAGRPF